jgi:hypothetical protein
MSTGPSMFTPNGTMRGACASAHSFSKMNFCTAFQPGPPYSLGQWLASQPRVEDRVPLLHVGLAQVLAAATLLG